MSLGFYFDNTRCIGCRVCQIACKDRRNLQKAGPRPRRADTFECGTYPNTGLYHLSISCNHCEAPVCVLRCPMGAMHKAADGTVQHNHHACIKCGVCIDACPYNAPQYATEIDRVVKCDTCKPLRDAGMNTTCTDACPMRAIDFGEIDSLKEKYGSNLVNEIPSLHRGKVDTRPNLLLKVKNDALRKNFRPISL